MRARHLLAVSFAAAACNAPHEPVGRHADGRQVTPVNQTLTPLGTFVDLPDMRPQVIALSREMPTERLASRGSSPGAQARAATATRLVGIKRLVVITDMVSNAGRGQVPGASRTAVIYPDRNCRGHGAD